MLGYYFPQPGEGLIVADTIEAGIALMKFKYSNVDKAVLPADNFAGIDFLKKNGFVEKSRCFRMARGHGLAWYPDKIFSRIGGNFG